MKINIANRILIVSHDGNKEQKRMPCLSICILLWFPWEFRMSFLTNLLPFGWPAAAWNQWPVKNSLIDWSEYREDK